MIDSSVVVTPSNKAVIAGQRMEMKCRTDSDWFVSRWVFRSFTNSTVFHWFDVNKGRYNAEETLRLLGFGIDLDGNVSAVLYSNETNVKQAGMYTCRATNAGGRESLHRAALIVFRKHVQSTAILGYTLKIRLWRSTCSLPVSTIDYPTVG